LPLGLALIILLLTTRNMYRYTIHSDKELPPSGTGEVLSHRVEGRDSAEARRRAPRAAVCPRQCQGAGRHECSRVEAPSSGWRTQGPVGGVGQRELATDLQVRRRGCSPRQLSGLSLGVVYAYAQSAASRTSPPRVPRRYGGVGSRGPSAGHARDSIARAERQSRNLRQHGSPPRGCTWDVAGSLDQHAVPIRPLACPARQAACSTAIPACGGKQSGGSKSDRLGFAQDRLCPYMGGSIPQRLPRLQRVLNSLLRLPLAA
jgi:hypothetical protein